MPGEFDLSVVMPVYNEEQALPGVLEEAITALARAPFTSEIILVDDASTDGSAEILADYQCRHPERNIRVLRHEQNRGIAAACATLFAAAGGRHIFLNGSDGQWRTAECLRMMERSDQYDIIVGRRRQKQYTPRRAAISWAYNFLPRVLFGVPTHDAGSIKLLRADLLAIPLISTSPFAEAERIIRAHKRGLRVGMIDVEHCPRKGGHATGARWRLVAHASLDLLRCWWHIVVRREVWQSA